MRVIWDLPLSTEGVQIELDDGRRVQIRPIRKSDKDTLLDAFDRLSPRSRYHRFFSSMTELPDGLADGLVDVDHRQHLAWVIADPSEESSVNPDMPLAIGAARIVVDEGDATTAEAAVALVDDYQRLGIGNLLIELLVSTAAEIGVDVLRFEVLRDNSGMRAVLKNLGARSRPVPGDAKVVHYLYDVPDFADMDVGAAGSLYELLRIMSRPDGE